MSKVKSFVLYGDFSQHFDLLTDGEIGLLFRSVFDYVNNSVIPCNLPPAVAMAFSVLRVQLDRDREKYIDVCKKRAEAGKIGGQQRAMNAKQMQASATKCQQSQAKQADNKSKNDSESKSVSDSKIIDNGAKAPTRKKFVAPDESDVLAYFAEQGSTNSEASSFYDYYTANGWTQGHGKGIRDWKAAGRSWIRRAGQFTQRPSANSEASPLEIYRNL